jgi:cellulose synthase/poly-beta-1,6-N-acetylglucosamine synthase-like glycosyltransferase
MKNSPRNSLPWSFALACLLLAASVVSVFSQSGALAWSVGFLYIGYDTFLIFFVLTQMRKILRASRTPKLSTPGQRVSIGVLITARNEARVMRACLDALEKQTDRPDEIIWVDDGSTDSSESLLSEINLNRTFKVSSLFKAHSGKADSLNRAWPHLNTDVIVTLDADTLLDPDAIAQIRDAFSQNPKLAATGGILTPSSLQAPGGAFEMFQQFEYLRSFLARRAWMSRNALLLVSGAFAAYRKKCLETVGGFDPKSLVEDYDLTHRIHRASYDLGLGYEVQVTIGARAITDVPGTLKQFLHQRKRWFAGFLQTQFKNSDMVGNRQYGAVGRFMLVIKSIDTLQPIFGLVALLSLIFFIVSGRAIPRLIWLALVGKISLDLFFHYYSLWLYYQWKREIASKTTWLKSTLSTFLEPLTFQVLRHLGALMGWIQFFRGKSDWTPQRARILMPPGQPHHESPRSYE